MLSNTLQEEENQHKVSKLILMVICYASIRKGGGMEESTEGQTGQEEAGDRDRMMEVTWYLPWLTYQDLRAEARSQGCSMNQLLNRFCLQPLRLGTSPRLEPRMTPMDPGVAGWVDAGEAKHG